MQNACAKYLSTELHTQPSDDDLYLIPDALLPIQTEIDEMNDSFTANMQTVIRDEIDIPSDNSAATVTTTNTDIRGDIQTAADDLRKLIKQAEKQKEVIRKLYNNINVQTTEMKSLIERHKADSAQRINDLTASSISAQTTITTKASEAVDQLEAHSTSLKQDLNGIYETMKSDLNETITKIDTRSSAPSHHQSLDMCKGNHDHVEDKIKSYLTSEIKELNKHLAIKITASLRIHKTELMKQIQEVDKGMSATAIKDLIDKSMLEFDNKISKSVASKVRKEKQKSAKLEDEVRYKSAPDYVESDDEI